MNNKEKSLRDKIASNVEALAKPDHPETGDTWPPYHLTDAPPRIYVLADRRSPQAIADAIRRGEL